MYEVTITDTTGAFVSDLEIATAIFAQAVGKAKVRVEFGAFRGEFGDYLVSLPAPVKAELKARGELELTTPDGTVSIAC